MKILGIDPGPKSSGVVLCTIDGDRLTIHVAVSEYPNADLLSDLAEGGMENHLCAIETPAALYAGAGKETIDTILFAGQLMQASHAPTMRISPQQVRMAICGTAKAKDSGVRAALIDVFGAPGTKKSPGQTHGITGHAWRALAVAYAAYLQSANDSSAAAGACAHEKQTGG